MTHEYAGRVCALWGHRLLRQPRRMCASDAPTTQATRGLVVCEAEVCRAASDEQQNSAAAAEQRGQRAAAHKAARTAASRATHVATHSGKDSENGDAAQETKKKRRLNKLFHGGSYRFSSESLI